MCEATALFGQAVLCAIFAANDPAQIDTSTALILLILVAVEEGITAVVVRGRFVVVRRVADARSRRLHLHALRVTFQ